MRELIALRCTSCKRKNYYTTKNKRLHPEKFSIKKYCRFERKHILHKEAKPK
ncbi:MAG: 50S ribosomal protein L33 [Candidatus Omnitrophica bacterium]|nr:50S ribosomal protein L33 [Candidatus Omnitrophota bacterium]MCF7894857.1 50S ribosomal protein L33 [Candidatus Omnitrophota bacterium]